MSPNCRSRFGPSDYATDFPHDRSNLTTVFGQHGEAEREFGALRSGEVSAMFSTTGKQRASRNRSKPGRFARCAVWPSRRVCDAAGLRRASDSSTASTFTVESPEARPATPEESWPGSGFCRPGRRRDNDEGGGRGRRGNRLSAPAVLDTRPELGQDVGLKTMCETIRRAVADAKLKMDDVTAIGVATPGLMDIKAGSSSTRRT